LTVKPFFKDLTFKSFVTKSYLIDLQRQNKRVLILGFGNGLVQAYLLKSPIELFAEFEGWQSEFSEERCVTCIQSIDLSGGGGGNTVLTGNALGESLAFDIDQVAFQPLKDRVKGPVIDYFEPPSSCKEVKDNLFYILTEKDLVVCSKSEEGEIKGSFKGAMPSKYRSKIDLLAAEFLVA